MKKVLIVEHFDGDLRHIRNGLDGRVEILEARTLDGGEQFFDNNANIIDLVIIQANMNSIEPNSMPLVKKIVDSGFKKPIIAQAILPSSRQPLIQAGATHESNYYEVGKKALELLDL